MIRIISLIVAFVGLATCIVATLAFFPLVLTSSWSLETVDRFASQAMTTGLALSALGGLGLIVAEVIYELRPA